MPAPDADVAILGAGPAGSIAARQLAGTGRSVLLFDPGKPPAGHGLECFPASGAPLAEATGLLGLICGASFGPAQVMHLCWRQNPETRDFGDQGPLLVDRAALHRALLAEALRDTAQVRHVGARARRLTRQPAGFVIDTDAGAFTARLVIDARGRAGGGPKPGAGDLVALPFSGRLAAGPVAQMYLEALPDAWIWAVRLADGAVHGALFQKPAALAGVSAAQRDARGAAHLRESRQMSGLKTCRFASPVAAGLGAVADPVPDPRHLVIGDAALARDPIASHGLVHALRSAVQGAAVAATILDPDGDDHAAAQFLRLKHRQACQNAGAATARAYADQGRFSTGFWDSEVSAGEAPVPPLPGRLRLARPLTRTPALVAGRIVWAAAIALPRTGDFAITLGPVSALDIASACRPAASLPELAARLGRLHSRSAVSAALDQLVAGGALARADG